MKKAAKHENVQVLDLILNGGLNYSQSRGNIADNELTLARNFIYDPFTDYLVTRPGTDCVTAAPLGGPITKGFYYEVDSTHAYHVCAYGTKLYYLSGAGLDEWTEIGTNLLTGTYPPSFLVFNKLLLIADGDTHIKSWAGVVLGTVDTGIADSPPANVLSMIRNRVVANSITDLDLITLSAPNDASATGWNTATTAVALRAGYGDLLTVNAFSVFGDDLIVSKKGDREKRLYRVNVADATTTNWYVQDLSQNNAAQNARAMVAGWNNVFFVDTNGFKSIKGTETYGDLSVDAMGRKINTVFSANYACDGMAYLPAYNAIWFNIGERVYCYTERNDPQSDENIPAFTDLYFKWGRCTSMYQAGDVVYLTGYNGYLYKLDESLSTDEVTPGVTSIYPATVRSKTFSFFVDGILRKLQFYLKPKAAGAGNIFVCTEENTKTLLKTVTITAEGEYLYDATGYFSAELMPNQVDRDFSGASAWADVDLVSGGGAYDETGDLTITAGAAGAGDYCTLPVASAPTTIGKTYRMRYDLANLVGTWTLKSFDGTQTIGTISANATQAYLEWTATTTGGYRLVAVSNLASGDFDNFQLYDVTSDITDTLYDTGTSPWVETSRNRLRNDEMAFELELTSGRCGFEWCKAEIALVEGGD
uniref:Uncharacterized protein n=1 Tax=viral metagenome TaxID=1070528 RepID=A0A6M3XQN7_9ZZZZ